MGSTTRTMLLRSWRRTFDRWNTKLAKSPPERSQSPITGTGIFMSFPCGSRISEPFFMHFTKLAIRWMRRWKGRSFLRPVSVSGSHPSGRNRNATRCPIGKRYARLNYKTFSTLNRHGGSFGRSSETKRIAPRTLTIWAEAQATFFHLQTARCSRSRRRSH